MGFIQNNKGLVALTAVISTVVIVGLGIVGYILLSRNPEPQASFSSSSTKNTNNFKKPANDPTEGWSNFTSPLSGYTVKYPSDWIARSQKDILTNGQGDVSYNFTLQSKKRSGGEASTYMCVNITEFTADDRMIAPRKLENTTLLEEFAAGPERKLAVVLQKNQQPLMGSLLVTEGGDKYVRVGDKYELTAEASYNCAQGDDKRLEASNESFMDRAESKTAQNILTSLRF